MHWYSFIGCPVPVRHRVTFKIATITFNLLKFRRPSYLYQFVQPYTPSRNLRSLNQNLLVVNWAHSAFAERSFRHHTLQLLFRTVYLPSAETVLDFNQSIKLNQSNFIMKCDKRTQNIESSVRMTVQKNIKKHVNT